MVDFRKSPVVWPLKSSEQFCFRLDYQPLFLESSPFTERKKTASKRKVEIEPRTTNAPAIRGF